MLFKMQNEVIFRQCKQLTSKKTGSPFYIVTVADPVGFETQDFFPDNPADFIDLKPGSKINIGMSITDRYSSLVLLK